MCVVLIRIINETNDNVYGMQISTLENDVRDNIFGIKFAITYFGEFLLFNID